MLEKGASYFSPKSTTTTRELHKHLLLLMKKISDKRLFCITVVQLQSNSHAMAANIRNLHNIKVGEYMPIFFYATSLDFALTGQKVFILHQRKHPLCRHVVRRKLLRRAKSTCNHQTENLCVLGVLAQLWPMFLIFSRCAVGASMSFAWHRGISGPMSGGRSPSLAS